jgi:hypothetical protein
MAKMGKYCKAYPIQRFREFKGWQENTDNLRKEKQQVDGREEMVSRQLTEDDFLYLQENFQVTDGIFIDENIVFAEVTPEWIDFCKNTLKFEVPVYEPVTADLSSGVKTGSELTQ